MNIIPYGKQHISEQDIDAVVNTLKSDFLTQGPKVEEFEIKFAHYIGSKYAVAVANGTAALHLSVLALGLEKGKKVITSPLTFVASANAVLYGGGEVDFCDIDPETLLLDIDLVREKLASSPKGTYCGIIPVDFAGAPVQMDAFRTLADEYGLWLLEDSCHAPGGYFYDSLNHKQKCGNGSFADLAIFSFHPVKHIASGEGGMITTNNKELYQKLSTLRSHGIVKEFDNSKEEKPGWYYEMQHLGFNYRLSDIACSLGISQLKRINQNLEKRKEIAQRYDEAFANKKVTLPIFKNKITHAYHLYVIQIENRNGLYNYLKSKGVFAQVHYIPVHLHPFYNKLGFNEGDYPNVESYYKKCLSLPIFPELRIKEVDYVISQILSFLNNNNIK
jgi:UDP-4-amino-4,6-dideoxy-N-acetyl-beta-L-altrosamine transaminase